MKMRFSLIWLSLVPVLTIVFGLAIGYISYTIYLPVWLLNVALMIGAMWTLGASQYRTADGHNKRLIIGGVFFIIPTLLTSMFFGLGAPPYESPATWVATITEQRTRYYFLLAAGLFIVAGFVLLGSLLKKAGEDFYATLAMAAALIMGPLFLFDMSFWGFYLTRLYQWMVDTHATKTPEWVSPLRMMFYYVNIFASALVYISTILLVFSLKKTGWFKPSAAHCYIGIAALFLLFALLPPTLPEPFATLNFIVSIPAVPFMFPYFIGINLLRLVRVLSA
ncbi:MAG: hypothetical protein QM726_10255 [Chitinophagaceae bacterium]